MVKYYNKYEHPAGAEITVGNTLTDLGISIDVTTTASNDYVELYFFAHMTIGADHGPCRVGYKIGSDAVVLFTNGRQNGRTNNVNEIEGTVVLTGLTPGVTTINFWGLRASNTININGSAVDTAPTPSVNIRPLTAIVKVFNKE